MKKKVYVAGKVSGLSGQMVKEKFSRITEELSGMGYLVVQPASVATHPQTWQDGIRADIKTMLECDEVHLLPCWQESRGAQLERDIALRMGMNVVYH